MKQFLSIREAAEELGVSKEYVRQLIKGIQANTPYRYTVSDVFSDLSPCRTTRDIRASSRPRRNITRSQERTSLVSEALRRYLRRKLQKKSSSRLRGQRYEDNQYQG